jgi:hypothetical protein
MSDRITCPQCKHEFEIAAAVASQLEARLRQRLEAELAPQRAAIANEQQAMRQQLEALQKRQEAIAQEKEAIARQKAEIERAVAEQVRQKLSAAEQELLRTAQQKAREELAVQMKAREEHARELEQKLEAARRQELEWLKRERELKTRAEELELQVARKVAEELDRVRQDTAQKLAEEYQLKDAEKDKKIADMLRQIDELKRKGEQGSQQAQGEILELTLEQMLRERFRDDQFEPVPKGVSGGDVVQRVRSPGGVDCGTILWETKRTRNWSDGWLAKLRQDQRDARAALAVIVSTALPAGVTHFAPVDGVWVASWPCAVGIAAALRSGLIEVAKARRAREGQETKQEMVYRYLTSEHFANRVRAIVEAVASMQKDLADEMRVLQKQWAKREQQIRRALDGVAGLFGDFQGIAGAASLPEIRGLAINDLGLAEPPASPRLTGS